MAKSSKQEKLADGAVPSAKGKSKAIKEAHKALAKAISKHAEVVTDQAVSLKRAQRAATKVAAAAAAYAEAVKARTGLESPFVDGGGALDADTKASLKAERNRIEKSLTGQITALEDGSSPEPSGRA